MSAAEDEVKAEMDALSKVAKRMGMKGDEITQYVHDHMTRLGYKSRRSYYKENANRSSRGSSWSPFGGSSDDNDED